MFKWAYSNTEALCTTQAVSVDLLKVSKINKYYKLAPKIKSQKCNVSSIQMMIISVVELLLLVIKKSRYCYEWFLNLYQDAAVLTILHVFSLFWSGFWEIDTQNFHHHLAFESEVTTWIKALSLWCHLCLSKLLIQKFELSWRHCSSSPHALVQITWSMWYSQTTRVNSKGWQ